VPGGDDILAAVKATRGHFLYESGHHGDLWLDLDELFVDARRAHSWAQALAQAAAPTKPDVVCGPLTGGAFVAQSMAIELGAHFAFAQRHDARYTIPAGLRAALHRRRVLLVDDAVNAASATRATLAELNDHGAELAGLASLLALGGGAEALAAEHDAPFFTLATAERRLWAPETCPLCAEGEPLLEPHGHA
jgi:orotate phosphoribosyltransferase